MNIQATANHIETAFIDLSDDAKIGSDLEAIFATYENPNDQYIKKVLRTLNEEIDIISISDSENDSEVSRESEYISGVEELVRNPLCPLTAKAKPRNGKSHKRKEHQQIFSGLDLAYGSYVAAECRKSTISESPEDGDSSDSTSDISDLLLPSPDDYTDNEADYLEDDSHDYYHMRSMPAKPLPSMPLYDLDFNLVEVVEPPPQVPEVIPPKRSEEELSEEESDTKGKANGLIEHIPKNGELPGDLLEPADKIEFTYWIEMSLRPIDRGEITEEEWLAIQQEEEAQRKSDKLSDAQNRSDDSDAEEANRENAKLRNGLDFYEDSVQFQIGSMASSSLLVIKEDAVFLEYEQCVKQLLNLVKWTPSFYKYEIYLLIYPVIAISYLQMMASDNISRARVFLNRYANQLDDSFTSRMAKLSNISRPADVPHRARKLLAGFEKLEMHMSEGAYGQFLEHMESWPKAQQDKVLTHFLVRRYSDQEDPQQRFAPGQALLETVFWAAPEPLHKKDYATRPLLRARRRKKDSLPDWKIHLPPGDRIYTPMPKRMDLLHRKTDEQYRIKLDRNTLPSAYLYTAPTVDEVVTCATFSEGVSILAVGTDSSAIHIYSLKPSKLVQLKSADWLKALDTGMAGIDKGMLDPSKKYSRRTLRGHQGPVYRLSFNPDDRFLLSCSEDCTVRLWCLMSWNCVVIYPGHLAPVCCVAYAPLGHYFATASDDGTARVWVQDNKRPVRIFKGHLAELNVCLFHPNRHYLATGSADATVRLWDICKGVQVRLFAGHRGRITALAFSQCGRQLVSGGDDSLIMIWDLANERLIQFLSHHKACINSIQFCLDNNLLLVGGQDCQLTVWDFKKILQDSKSTRSEKQGEKKTPESLQTKDFLIRSYYTKDAPFYTIRFTRRNLLLAFCVTPREPESHIERARERQESEDQKREDLENWFTFLDLLKMKTVMGG